jgi:hypothetical protein
LKLKNSILEDRKKIFDELMLLNRNIIIGTGGGTPLLFLKIIIITKRIISIAKAH